MKTTINLLTTGMVVAFCCSVASAQIIYSNSFDGGAVDINGTAPTYINPSAPSFGGSLGAAFDVVTNNAGAGYAAYQDGTLGSKLNSVLLPFTPQNGYIYTLSYSLTFQSVPPAGGWGGFGFAKYMPASNSGVTDPRMGSANVGGQLWTLLNMYANGGGAQMHVYGSVVGQVPNLMTATGTPYTINLVLDTTGAQWSSAEYVAGTLITNYVFSVNPTITSFGYTQTTTTAGAFKWNSMTLSAVPEPSTPALIGVGLATMLFVTSYRRRRFAAGKSVVQ